MYSSARKEDDKCGMLVCVSYGEYVLGGNVVTITHQRPCLLVLAPNFSPQLMFSYTSYLGGGRISNEATRVHQLLSSESELRMTTKHEHNNVGATTSIFIIVIRVASAGHESGLPRLGGTVTTKFM